MKTTALFTILGLTVANSAFAQQCDLVDDNFDTAPLLAPITSVAGWTSGFANVPTIQFNNGGSRAATINTAGFGGVSTASRALPVSATGSYSIDVEIDASSGSATGNFSLDCSAGVASQVSISGGTVASIYGPTMTVPTGPVAIRYEVDDSTGYSLFVNGIFFETMLWPVTSCATRPTMTISAPLTFGGGFVYYDNLCVTSSNGFTIGTNYCTAVANTTGSIAEILAVGSAVVSQNNVELRMNNMPSNSFGFFIVSQMQGFVVMPGGSSGNLCLSGSIGRYVGPGQIMNGGPQGMIALPIDLAQTPQPTGFVAVNAGETWNFQGWYRDSSPSGPTTNFSEGCEILFQ